MKRSILLLMLVFVVGITASAQKFAFIDMEYIYDAIPAYEQINEQLDQATEKYQKEVQAKMEEIKKLYDDYQAKANTLKENQKTERENAIIAKEKEVSDLRRTYFGPEGELFKMRENLMRPIDDAIYNAVKEIAQQRDYSAIIDRGSAVSVIFASPDIDVSNQVLAKLGYSN
ncbi:MAG: OmpH family outer membrane protein [Bacteroides sp.]|nr:OmpH family outer membrane protein [Bacteroides sp.]